MTGEERIKAVVDFGFTERQARFLVTVMLHSGVCLLRQYTAFAGIVHGQKTRKFFAKLVRRGYARAYPCRHNRGRVYHLDHKPLYRAIGQTDSRHRRPMSAARVVEGLVLLDALLVPPSVVWLATEDEKQVHLTGLAGVTPEAAARLARPERACKAARAVRDRMPIGVDLTGRWVLVYVVTGDLLDDFHWFLQQHVLQQHATLLAVLPAWTLRVVFPPHLAFLAEGYDKVARNELASPQPEFINHLRWYFKQRRAHTLERAQIDDPERYDQARYAFAATRFQVLYRRWLGEGDTVFEAISTDAIAEAIEHGVGRIECHVLPFSYRHLSPLVGERRSKSKGAEKGEDGPAPSRPPLRPSTDVPETSGEQAIQADT
ncbi:MAG: hypothetical protein HYY76_08795 [Acidobacteria bacterium]|nr:hypothetical protein [Acidobacteriota bacterium]